MRGIRARIAYIVLNDGLRPAGSSQSDACGIGFSAADRPQLRPRLVRLRSSRPCDDPRGWLEADQHRNGTGRTCRPRLKN